ncbi:MAG: NAD(P)-dependent oxidoreductase [Hyphomicrobiales bacterium]|nr:NAD(P)-dependent oxidoreductase [Hyphomicrobiales bacterium]
MGGDQPAIGFIGLGLMGTPIAMKMLETGFGVTVWGRTASKLEPALEAGAVAAESPAALAARSDYVFLCVSDATAVEDVVFSANGIATGAGPGRILVDHSSIRPAATREMAARLVGSGMAWIDAPVSGGAAGVADKTLAVMCGGDPDVFERVRPVIESYAGRCTLMGGIGAGQTTKLFNQAICGVTFATLGEIAVLAQRAGVDVASLPAALAGGRADSRLLQEYLPLMVSEDSPQTGRIDMMLKDLDSLAELARDTGSAVPFSALATEVHRLLVARGMGGEDPAAIVKFFR